MGTQSSTRVIDFQLVDDSEPSDSSERTERPGRSRRTRTRAMSFDRCEGQDPVTGWNIDDRRRDMPRITPNLWFDTEGKEAAEFYVSVFPNSEIRNVSYYGEAG